MSVETDALNAPAPETTSPAPDAPPPAAPLSTPETPATPAFLEPNERTRYASKEDAIKGYNELQGRVTSLSKWEEAVAKRFQGADPETVAQALNELIERRERETKQATPAASSTAATVQAAQAGDKLAYESLSPEWKAHVDYLNNLGFVTKDALKPFQERLDRFDQQSAAAQQAQLQAVRSDGETILNSIVEREKLPLDDAGRQRMGNAIEDEIVRSSRDERNNIIPNSVEDRFIRGTAAERTKIIEEGVQWFTDFGKKFATAQNASYVAAKTTAQANQPRTLPQGSSPSSTEHTGRMTEDQRKAAVKALFADNGFK